jgi:UDP-N-acetylenolpyruvoylglucosamine reductase
MLQAERRFDPETVADFGKQLDGRVFEPADTGYEAARAIWNGMIDKRPALVVCPTGVADVQRAVTFARRHDLPLSIKGGGHNVAGHAIADGGLMLNLSTMRSVRVHPTAHTARVEGGATWADVDRETGVFGLATTGGVVAATGVGGLTLGGGIGWLVGKHGMTIDNLLEVDLITADGEFLTASAAEHPDLYWALRGGGGNFGVVTSFEFRLHPLERVLAGTISYPIEAAGAALDQYRDFTANAPDDITTYVWFGTDEDTEARVCGFDFCYAGDPTEGERVIAPLRRLGTPLIEEIAAMAYPIWQAGPEFPFGDRYYWKSNLFCELPDEALRAIAEQGANSPLKTAGLAIEHYHGAFNRPGIGDTAYPHRDTHYQLVILGCWDDPSDDAAGIDWVRETFAVTEPYSKPAQFLNFNIFESDEQVSRVRAGYGPNWDRLVAIKRRYDPSNVFRANNNIPLDADLPKAFGSPACRE